MLCRSTAQHLLLESHLVHSHDLLHVQENQWGPPETFSREALLGELSKPGFLALLPSHILQLHHLLEQEFMPLDLCQKVESILDGLEDLAVPMSATCPVQTVDFKRYRAAIRRVSVLHMLKQLSNVYLTMKTEKLAGLVPFFSFGEVEAIIVDAVKNNYMKVGVGSVFQNSCYKEKASMSHPNLIR